MSMLRVVSVLANFFRCCPGILPLAVAVSLSTGLGCASTSPVEAPDRNVIKGTLIYIEPFPFQTQYTAELADVYMQAAWVQESGTGDSLAVLFNFDVTGGRDVASMTLDNFPYTFTVDPDPYEASESEVSEDDRLTGVSTIVIPGNQRVRAGQYWLVTRVSFP